MFEKYNQYERQREACFYGSIRSNFLKLDYFSFKINFTLARVQPEFPWKIFFSKDF